jgi:hypothetical protein
MSMGLILGGVPVKVTFPAMLPAAAGRTGELAAEVASAASPRGQKYLVCISRLDPRE